VFEDAPLHGRRLAVHTARALGEIGVVRAGGAGRPHLTRSAAEPRHGLARGLRKVAALHERRGALQASNRPRHRPAHALRARRFLRALVSGAVRMVAPRRDTDANIVLLWEAAPEGKARWRRRLAGRWRTGDLLIGTEAVHGLARGPGGVRVFAPARHRPVPPTARTRAVQRVGLLSEVVGGGNGDVAHPYSSFMYCTNSSRASSTRARIASRASSVAPPDLSSTASHPPCRPVRYTRPTHG